MFLFFKISSLRGGTFMFTQFSGAPNSSLYTLKRLLFSESSVQNFLIPAVNSLIIPGPKLYIDYFSPMMVSIIPHGTEDSHIQKHHLQLFLFSNHYVMEPHP